MPLKKGDSAPEITAKNQRGETVSLSFETPTVLYFYPKDDTPGCTVEARQFNLELETYRDAGVDVYGVSMDDIDSHKDFAEKYDLGFDLLADPNGEIARKFKVDTSQGRTERTTFVLDDREVKATYTGVKPDGHAREVLSDMIDEGLATL
ncbi:MAG: peroxiredoxin [Halobacteria archaeon]|nr:peroxiredoxin [Halobacteria archaeon]